MPRKRAEVVDFKVTLIGVANPYRRAKKGAYKLDIFRLMRSRINLSAAIRRGRTLDDWLDDDMMLKIAAENNLSETAFFVRESDLNHIRWFTPRSK